MNSMTSLLQRVNGMYSSAAHLLTDHLVFPPVAFGQRGAKLFLFVTSNLQSTFRPLFPFPFGSVFLGLFLKCCQTVAAWLHCIDYNTTSARLSKLGASPAAHVSGGQIPP